MEPGETRKFPARPFIGALAVVQKSELFLLIRRAKPPNKGAWGFPGGVQETGETISQCAIRELAEETGISAVNPRILVPFDVIEKVDGCRTLYHFLLVPVVLDWVAGAGGVSEEVDELGWFDSSRVFTLSALPMVQAVMAAARRS